MDDSLDAVAGPSKSLPADDSSAASCFVTPTKMDVSVSSPRRSPRVPKLTFPDWCSPDSSCDSTPSTSRTPKSKVTSTPRDHHDSPPSPNVEPVSSSDSFVMPTLIRKALSASPRKTPSKVVTPGSKETPGKGNESGPSPYKSQWPKFLPKNIKLVKKKRLEREDFLQKVDKFDAQLVKLPAELSSTKQTAPVVTNDGDLLGIQTPYIVFFNPKNFFVDFDEHTFNQNGVMTKLALNPFQSPTGEIRAEYLKNMALFLTVTSQKFLFDCLSPFVEAKLRCKEFALDWGDLKRILVNFGLSKNASEFDRGSYSVFMDKKRPQVWNLKFLLMMIGNSFERWSKDRLLRLVKFLSDCLFDPIMHECQFQVGMALRQVLKYLMRNGSSVAELMPPLGHIHLSVVCNRFIVQVLSREPELRILSRALGYATIAHILHRPVTIDRLVGPRVLSFAEVAAWLSNIAPLVGKLGLKDTYQLISVCENLAAISPWDEGTKAFLEKLADFAEHMSQGYSYFENVYFFETVTRLRTLCTIEHL